MNTKFRNLNKKFGTSVRLEALFIFYKHQLYKMRYFGDGNTSHEKLES